MPSELADAPLGESKPGQLSSELGENPYPPDIAEFISRSPKPVRDQVFETLPAREAAEVIEELPIEVYRKVLSNLTHEKIRRVLDEMDPDEAVDLLELLPESDHPRLLADLDPHHRSAITRLKKYDPETAGGLMTTEFVAVRPDTKVSQILPTLQRESDEAETINYIYITDEYDKLLGVVSIREIITHDADTLVKELTGDRIITCETSTDQEEVARLVEKYNISAIPVVDMSGTLLGIVTVDDVIDVIQEEANEDFSRLAGTPTRHPLAQSVAKRVQARLPWMIVTLLLGLLTAVYISHFDAAMGMFAGLTAIFMPVLAGMGGNVGIQSSTIIVRAIATGEIRHRRVLSVVLHEAAAGSLLGGACALLSGSFTALIVPYFTHDRVPATFGLVVGGSMFLGMTVSSACGASIPFLFRGLGKDPALASGPFVTTINDVLGLTVYFSLITALGGFLATAA